MNGFANNRVVGAAWQQRGRPSEWGIRATVNF